MEGKNKEAGAICMVTTVRNPIKLARAVMEKSIHVMLVGEGAEQFAKSQGLELVPNSYFDTEYRWN
jgi:beta-aspartyl-peptidase (threonine type)